MCTILLVILDSQCVQMDSGGKTRRKQRPFDFTKYNTRHVALKIAYLGWDYQVNDILQFDGLCSQSAEDAQLPICIFPLSIQPVLECID